MKNTNKIDLFGAVNVTKKQKQKLDIDTTDDIEAILIPF